MKIVLDTNVIVSALININGIPAEILSLVLNGKIQIVYDNRIIFEYYGVLTRKRFGFNREITDGIIDYFKHDGEFINGEYSNMAFSDKTDKKFYEVYKSGKAQYLVTGNIKHFPEEDAVVTPNQFMKIWANCTFKQNR